MKKRIADFRAGINSKLHENLTALTSAKISYNFEHFGGSLKCGLPFGAVFGGDLASEAVLDRILVPENGFNGGAIFYFEKFNFNTANYENKLILLDSNLNAYYANLADAQPTLTSLNLQFTSVPTAFNYRLMSEDVIIFCSETDNMVVWNGVDQPDEILDAPKILSCAVHNERLFATTAEDPNMLWFSDDLNPTNWSVGLNDAGYIQLADERGKILKVVSFGGYLYVFRERGISRLTANGLQSEFYLGHCYVSSGRIFEKTIAVCGDRIVFVASDGVYVFDGANTTRILENIDGLITVGGNCSSEFFNGKYYLSCKVNFNDASYADSQEQVNCILEYDIHNGEHCLRRGLSAVGMVRVVNDNFNTLAVLLADRVVGHIGVSSPCVGAFKTGLYDFLEPSKKKTVRRVSAFVEGPSVEFVLYNETGKEKSVVLKNGCNSVSVIFSGEQIGYKVVGTNGSKLSDLVLEVY